MSLTRETLMKMNKDLLAASLVLDYNEMFDSTLFAINDEVKELKTDFRKLESDVAISRMVNGKLTKLLILVKRNVGQTSNTLVQIAFKYQELLSLFRMMTRKTAVWKFSTSVTSLLIQQILKLATI